MKHDPKLMTQKHYYYSMGSHSVVLKVLFKRVSKQYDCITYITTSTYPYIIYKLQDIGKISITHNG